MASTVQSSSGPYTGTGGATTTIALNSGPTFNTFNNPSSINASGTVAFWATLRAGAGGGDGIFTGAGGATTAVALSSGPTFSAFRNSPSINTAGTVAFLANLDAGGSGIYIGDGGAGTRVIGTGDALFGSTVSSLGFGYGGLNDVGQLSFLYTLADGTTGIAVATPEPTSAALLLGGSALLVARRRRG